jgi:phosphate/sulfate permease
MSDTLLEVLLPFAPFIVAIFVVGIVMWAGVQRNRSRLELRKEVVAKFSSGQELSDFLASDAGKRLMRDATDSQWASMNRVLKLAVAGLIALGAGVGFYFGSNDTEAIGLFIGVGIALLVSSAVAFFLAKRLGLPQAPVENSFDR